MTRFIIALLGAFGVQTHAGELLADKLIDQMLSPALQAWSHYRSVGHTMLERPGHLAGHPSRLAATIRNNMPVAVSAAAKTAVPKKPRSAFSFYTSQWKSLSAQDKTAFQSQVSKDKQRYEKELEEFRAAGGILPAEAAKKAKGPKKACTAYVFFSKEEFKRLPKEITDQGFQVAGKAIGDKWKAMDEKAKAPYEKMCEDDKERYEKELAEFIAAGGLMKKQTQDLAFKTFVQQMKSLGFKDKDGVKDMWNDMGPTARAPYETLAENALAENQLQEELA